MSRTTAKFVLSESILDIKAGHWICGELMLAAEANGNKKPDGCAVGLAVINARLEPILIVEEPDVESGKVAICHISDPSDYFGPGKKHPQARLDALKKSLIALALAIPTNKRPQEYDENKGDYVPVTDEQIRAMGVEELESMIIEYNDSSIDVSEAETWFKKALKIVSR